MSQISFWVALTVLVLFSGPLSPSSLSKVPIAKIISEGYVECFKKLKSTCELSAVVFDEKRGEILLGNDKPIPGKNRSPIFAIKWNSDSLKFPGRKKRFLLADPIKRGKKFEGFTITPDGKYILATTARKHLLLAWPSGREKEVQILSPPTSPLWSQISRALKTGSFPKGVSYFSIEGLAAIPENRLLFGIRKFGEKDRVEYTAKIFSVSYEVREGKIFLANDLRLVYQFQPGEKIRGKKTLALSGMEYDKYNDRLYILTSFEEGATDEGLGGFLWVLPMENFKSGPVRRWFGGKFPLLVLKEDGKPLMFPHKPEGITVLGERRVFIIHDDDHVTGRFKITNKETQFFRRLNQSAYSVVELL